MTKDFQTTGIYENGKEAKARLWSINCYCPIWIYTYKLMKQTDMEKYIHTHRYSKWGGRYAYTKDIEEAIREASRMPPSFRRVKAGESWVQPRCFLDIAISQRPHKSCFVSFYTHKRCFYEFLVHTVKV